MAAGMGTADVARAERLGLGMLSVPEALALLDLAVDEPQPASAVPARLRLDRLGAATPEATVGTDMPAREESGSSAPARQSLVTKLPALSADEQQSALIDLLRREAAVVLVRTDPEAIDAERGLLDLGFDSLTVVELRNRLAAATGVKLASTLAFDHPSLAAIAEHLRERLGLVADPAAQALAGLADLRRVLAALPATDPRRPEIVAGLRELVGPDPDGGLDPVSDDELFAALDGELT